MTDAEKLVRERYPNSYCGRGTISVKYWVMEGNPGRSIGGGFTRDEAWAEAAHRIRQGRRELVMGNHDHIPTEEIEKDIADTEREIAQMEIEAGHFEQSPVGSTSYRWDHMRAEHRRNGIRERQEFIEKLRGILAQRPSISPAEHEEEMRKEYSK